MFPKKIHHVILFVISAVDRGLGATELDNIIYLIDVDSAKTNTETMTGNIYVRKTWGPYSNDLRDAIGEMRWNEVQVTTEVLKKSGKEKYVHTLNNYPRFEPQLEIEEIEIILSVLDKIRGLSPIQINQMCFHTPPMEAVREKEKDERLIDEELVLT